MSRILVTGANGHLGSCLVRELLARGHQVVPFVLRGSSLEGLAGLPVTPVPGDVTDRASLAAAADGCEVAINLAAHYVFRCSDAEAIRRPAVEGVRNLLEVAAQQGLRRVIHTSSTVAVGNSDSPVLRSEKDWNDAPLTPYYRAKTDSERVAWDLARRRSVPLVVLNPAAIVGRHDYRLTPTNGFLAGYLNGEVMTGTGGYNYVDVRDVALAHALAVEKAVPGERYIIGGENLDFATLGRLVGELSGRAPRHVPGPRWLSLAAIAALQATQRARGRDPSLTLDEVRDLAGRWGWFDSSKAEQALGYRPRRARVSFEDATRWLVHRRVLKPEVLARLASRFPPVDWNARDAA